MRISNAKAYLKKYPAEKIAHVARMFSLSDTTLHNSIASETKPDGPGSGGHNKILEKY